MLDVILSSLQNVVHRHTERYMTDGFQSMLMCFIDGREIGFPVEFAVDLDLIDARVGEFPHRGASRLGRVTRLGERPDRRVTVDDRTGGDHRRTEHIASIQLIAQGQDRSGRSSQVTNERHAVGDHQRAVTLGVDVMDMSIDQTGHKIESLSFNDTGVEGNPGGGGIRAESQKFFDDVITGYKQAKIPNSKLIIITGPYADYKNTHENIKVKTFEPHLLELIQQSNLVISHAGYNTITELISLQSEAIIIPRQEFFESQEERAQFFSNDQLTILNSPDPNQISNEIKTKFQSWFRFQA